MHLCVTFHSQFVRLCDFDFPNKKKKFNFCELYRLMCVYVFSVSAFVTKLVKREDILLENVNTSPKPKNVESTMESDVGVGRDFCALDVNNKGIVYVCYLLFNLFYDCNMTPSGIIPANKIIAVI